MWASQSAPLICSSLYYLCSVNWMSHCEFEWFSYYQLRLNARTVTEWRLSRFICLIIFIFSRIFPFLLTTTKLKGDFLNKRQWRVYFLFILPCNAPLLLAPRIYFIRMQRKKQKQQTLRVSHIENSVSIAYLCIHSTVHSISSLSPPLFIFISLTISIFPGISISFYISLSFAISILFPVYLKQRRQ